MSNVIPIHTAQLKTNLDYALAYASIGWHVLPVWWADGSACGCGKPDCKNPGKHPFTTQGQNDATTNEKHIRAWWGRYPKLNIGIFLAPSKLVAVDIDPRNGGHETIEMLEDKHGAIFSDVMQFTGGGGEHRIFTLPQGLQNLPGKLGAGVDLKLNGYILVEPSNHASGNSYEFEASSNPLDGVAPSPLPDFIRDLSFGREIAPKSDAFISRFVTEEQITDLRSALTFIDSDDRDTWVRVGNALKTIGAAGWNLWLEYSRKSDKFDVSDASRVWHSFRPHSISYESVFHMAQEAGWVNMPTHVESIIDFSLFQKKEPHQEGLKRLPGVLGDIEDYYNATAYIPQPAFAQQTALAIASTMLGRRFRTEYDDYSSLYFACIAPSACGKEHVKTVAGDVFTACEKDFLAGDGYTSAGGVISALKERPTHLSIIDELGLYLEASNNKNNHIGRTANTLLMECIGRVKREIRSKNYSTVNSNKDSSEVIKCPAISIVGLTTPSTFYANLSIDMIKDGFFGRFLSVQSRMPRVAPRKVKPINIPSSVTAWSDAIDSRIHDSVNAFSNYSIIGDQCVIAVDDEAIDMLSAFSAEMVDIMNELEREGIEALAGRAGEFAARVAFIIAMSCDPYASRVKQDHAETAIDYVRRVTLATVDDIRENLVGSVYEKAKKEVLDAIRLSGNGVTERDMHRVSPFSKFKDKELAEVLQALVKSESIALVNTREGKPGKPRMAFVAIESSN